MAGMILRPAAAPLEAVVRIPGSKSLTNRALLVASLADGPSKLRNVLLADDTCHMIDCLRALEIDARLEEAPCTVPEKLEDVLLLVALTVADRRDATLALRHACPFARSGTRCPGFGSAAAARR